MAFYDIFEQLCEEKGVTPTQAARENGITQQAVSLWKKRGSVPNAQTLVKLSDYFNTTPAYLMGNPMAKHPDAIRLSEKLKESKPFYKNSDAESYRAGFIQFQSEEDRIVYFYNLLNTDGKLVASKCFYQHLDKDNIAKVADYVEKLSEIPQYQHPTTSQPPTKDDSEE